MDYTPEAWDVEFEDFNKAIVEDTMVICVYCDWIGDVEDVQDELFPECPKCGNPVKFDDGCDEDCPLDGDAESALASIGWGMDEDYGYYGDEF